MSNSEAFKGIAPKIVGQNIPVVIAMQYEIPNVFAGVFSSEFYERLAKGEPVDIAAQNGRDLLALETQHKSRDFATPVIFMNVQNGYLFTPPKPVSDNEEKKTSEEIINSVINDNENRDKFVLKRELTSEQKGELKGVLSACFKSSKKEFDRILSAKSDLANIIGEIDWNQSINNVVSDVVDKTGENGLIEELLNVVLEARLNNPKLKQFRQSL